MKNKISATIAITFLLVTVAAFAANFTDDTLQIGKPGSSADKSVVFGASNKKKLSHKPSTQTLDYEGNNLSVGDGLNTSDKTLKLNKGANSPTLRHNFTSGDLEIENAPVLNQKGNTVSVGDGTNTNKVLKFNKGASSPEIRYNSTTGKLQFTNDTTTYKDIGSGSGGGGGTNLLQEFNSDFESGSPPQNWAASGGTFIAETTDPLFGLQSGSWDSNASSQTLSSQLVTIEKGFIGKKCTADIEYRWPSGVSGDISFQVVNQTPAILATVNLEPTTGSNTRKAFLAFDCPTVATDQLRVRLLSNVSNPALIVVDNAFVGVNKSTVNVAQAHMVFEGRYPRTASCTVQKTVAGLSNLSTAASCPAITTEYIAEGYSVTATDFDTPAKLTLNNLKPGVYTVELHGGFYTSPVVSTYLGFTDGTTTKEASVGNNNSGNTGFAAAKVTFTYTSPQASKTFEFLASASGATFFMNNETVATKWYVEYSPLNTAEALNLETTGWFFDANIGGSHASLSSGAVTSFTEITNASLDMILRPGSASGRITCSATNAPTGLTCSAGNESLGANVDVPYAGTYEVCAEFAWTAVLGGCTTCGSFPVFQWVETPSNAQTILQEGGSRIESGISKGSALGTISENTLPQKVCGVFNFPSAGNKTVRLMYEQGVVGSPGAPLVLGDRAANNGQRDIRVTMRPFTQNFPAPVFTEVRNKMNAGLANVSSHSCSITNSGTPTIDSASGLCASWVGSLTDNGVGDVTLNFSPAFSSPPNCVCSGVENIGTPNLSCQFKTVTASAARAFVAAAGGGGALDRNFTVFCSGLR